MYMVKKFIKCLCCAISDETLAGVNFGKSTLICQTLFGKNLFSYTNNDLLVKFTKLIPLLIHQNFTPAKFCYL